MAYDIISTVTVPATSYDLVDIRTIKDEIGLKDAANDDYLARAISQVSRRFANGCNRVFQAETVQDLIYPKQDAYPYEVPGTLDGIQLSRWPIMSITSTVQIVSAGSTLALSPGTDFTIDARRGQLVRLNNFTGAPMAWEALPLRVLYVAGYDPIPDDVEEAVMRMVITRFKGRERDPAVRSRSDGAVGTQSFWLGIPPDIQNIIDNYRVPVVA